MKDKEEEVVQQQYQQQQQQQGAGAGRPQQQQQPQEGQNSAEVLIPQFLVSLAKDSASPAAAAFECDRGGGGGGRPGGGGEEQCRSDLTPLLGPLPLSSRPPPQFSDGLLRHGGEGQLLESSQQQQQHHGELVEDDGLFGGSAGNRWPRQETLALLKIRQDMDSAFRDATLKAPLWDEVSRRLAALGFHRSSKKCKEKFENVYKYYKRTKAGRSGSKHVGKTYKFFDQLEALYGNAGAGVGGIAAAAEVENNGHVKLLPNLDDNVSVAAAASGSSHEVPTQIQGVEACARGPVLSSLSLSSESSEETYDDEHNHHNRPESSSSRKRKRVSTRKMMAFFEKMIEKVMEKQEMMQRKLLDTIERREQDRMAREETWRRQEMARLTRETELRSQERMLSASRDRALVEFLQKFTGQAPPEMPPPAVHVQVQPIAQVHPYSHSQVRPQPIPSRHENTSNSGGANVVFHHHHQDNNNNPEAASSSDPNSKRWPKQEVHALIQIRTFLEPRFHDAGPKAQLWDQISSEMAKLGYRRSAKRCKEKWENINKYFKKAKESNKERPENANTCPYFHQLDALYRKGVLKYSYSESKPLLLLDQQQTVAPAAAAPEQSSKDDEANNNNDRTNTINAEHETATPANNEKEEDQVKVDPNDNNGSNSSAAAADAAAVPIPTSTDTDALPDFMQQQKNSQQPQPNQINLRTDLDLGFTAAVSSRDASSSPPSLIAMVADPSHQMSIPGSSSSTQADRC